MFEHDLGESATAHVASAIVGGSEKFDVQRVAVRVFFSRRSKTWKADALRLVAAAFRALESRFHASRSIPLPSLVESCRREIGFVCVSSPFARRVVDPTSMTMQTPDHRRVVELDSKEY
jgi:hypothetical protein